ncbi:MAG: PIN domain-containing protein [Eubacteriales bacterium]|nr:PIN domain-containing protein [Eubacteriales bacterium]
MRVLLDTNIIIYRENKKMTNYSIGHLFRWLDKLKYDKLIHPLTKKEIAEYQYADPAESMTLKLDAYQELKTQAPMAEHVTTFAKAADKNENDRVDMALLNEVYQGRVDLLITEDKRLRKKAETLGLGHKVFSINAFLSVVTNENPSLIEYKALAVRKILIGEINVRDSFFDSLRSAYAGFDTWFNSKCDEDAYICQDDTGQLLGFLYLKTESADENYSDITPIFRPQRRLKIGTFKVVATGFRLGERFIKIILDNAIERNVDEVYVTLFEDRAELETLATLLLRWGFEKYGMKNSTGETVLTKQMKHYLTELTPRQNFPNIVYNKQKFILPILPQYHTSLLPDSILRNENESDFLAKTPYRYALQKVYISFSPERNIKPGDIVVFYRNGVAGNAGHTAVLTSIAIVEEAIYGFTSKEDYMSHVQNRSVFTDVELEQFWRQHRGNQIVLKFIFVKSFAKRPILKFLWDNDIIAFPSGPRPFTRISDDQFNMILNEAQTDLSHYWR